MKRLRKKKSYFQVIYKFKGKNAFLVKRRQTLPNQRIVDVETVEHPGAVLVVPIVSSQRICMIRQYRPVLKKYLYEFPAGTLNHKESLLECAQRELREETGFKAERLEKIGHLYPVPGYSTERITVFKAQGLTLSSANKDPDEIIKLCSMTRTQIKKMFQDKKIMDGKTICALVFCGLI